MKRVIDPLSMIGVLSIAVFMSGCQSQKASNAQVKAPPKPGTIKSVEISIETAKSGLLYKHSTSFAVAPETKPSIDLYWDGKKFISKTDSGETFLNFSPNHTFEKQQKAEFVIKKKVTVKESNKNQNDSVTMSVTDTILVRRGVATTL